MILLVSLAAAAVLGGVGALLGSPSMTVTGCLGGLVVLAVHPWTRAAPVRGLLWAGLGLLGVAVVAYASGWSDPMTSASTADLVARFTDPDWGRSVYRRHLVVAYAIGMALVIFVWPLVRVGWRRAVLVPALGVSLLGVLFWQAVESAWVNRPRPVERGTFVSVLVTYDSGPNVDGAVGALILLLGAAAVVLGVSAVTRR